MTQPELTTAPVLSTNPTYEPASISTSLQENPFHIAGDIPTIYETKRTIDWILENDFSRIALQFPDELLSDSTSVEQALQDGLRNSKKALALEDGVASLKLQDYEAKQRKVYILADTSYGSCCVDEIAAEHAAADCIVHYGRACLSPTNRLPVLHIYTTLPLELQSLIASFLETFPDKSTPIILTSSLPYSSQIPTLHENLTSLGYTSLFASSVIRNPSSPIPNRTSPPLDVINTYHIFHIDEPLTSLILTLSALTSSTSLQIYNPSAKTTTQSLSSRILRRRYALLSHIRSSGVFGILINTLTANNYLSTINTLKSLLSKHHKKSYLVTVGKLNPAKLANFAEVEVWIVVGCWESAVVDEGRQMWRVVVTPWEVSVALEGGEGVGVEGWRGDWEAFRKKVEEEPLKEEQAQDDDEGNDDSEEESEPPVFDLRTGRYISSSAPMRAPRTMITSEENTETALTTITKEKGLTVRINNQISPAAEYLQQKRGWTGLGSDYAEVEYDRDGNEIWRGTEGAIVEEGRKGVARGYVVQRGDDKA
ncbi:hypothetical protein ABW19_dt0200973 [Dactylella cylindrospora]|nr:hypothetical protein ABW19_dt0200973 [Dactylella cylindrospora]